MKVNNGANSEAVRQEAGSQVLLLPLERRGEGVLGGGMTADLLKMLAAAAVMGLCAHGVLGVLEMALPAGKVGELLSLGLCALFGLAVYFLMAVLLGLQEAKLVISLFTKRKRG